jgi:cytidyltransferase-like protein
MFKQKRNLLSVLFVCSITFGLYYWSTTKKKPVRVYADMIGDMFHPGHVEFLKKAKAFGDVLIVGLVSDEDAGPYKRRPIMTLAERTAAVQACRLVDEVIPCSPMITTKEFMEKHNIDIVVHGDDYSEQQRNAYYGDAIKMGKYRSVPYTKGISTSDLIARIKSRDDLAKKS